MTTTSALDRGREAFARQDWATARLSLAEAEREAALAPPDIERFASAAYLTGHDDESAQAWMRAHREALRRDDVPFATRSAFWLGMQFLESGDMAQASGWLGRARRLIDDYPDECVERGYVLLPGAIQALDDDPSGSFAAFQEAAVIAERFADPDLTAFSYLGRGQSLLRLGQVTEGMALLDEAMVAVTASDVSPIVVGAVYCSVIESCQMLFDIRRAQEWTSVLSSWCEAHPDLVPFRGHCLVYRAEIMQLHGAWADALDETRRAWGRAAEIPGAGAALYRRAELYRLRGEWTAAEETYREASQEGWQLEPGLALLRLAQGRVDAATASIRRAMDEAPDGLRRSRLLAAYVEIMLAAGELEAAGSGADELTTLAADLKAPLLHATSDQARGAVLLAEGDARGALRALRAAWTAWHELSAPYEAARTRVLIALACRALEDADAAAMELEAARAAFSRLGAVPDLARLEALDGGETLSAAGGLTAREVEVLRLVAAGKTNRAIASALVISEKTVARHVSNIFTKLDVPSRSAATAYAYEHDLV